MRPGPRTGCSCSTRILSIAKELSNHSPDTYISHTRHPFVLSKAARNLNWVTAAICLYISYTCDNNLPQKEPQSQVYPPEAQSRTYFCHSSHLFCEGAPTGDLPCAVSAPGPRQRPRPQFPGYSQREGDGTGMRFPAARRTDRGVLWGHREGSQCGGMPQPAVRAEILVPVPGPAAFPVPVPSQLGHAPSRPGPAPSLLDDARHFRPRLLRARPRPLTSRSRPGSRRSAVTPEVTPRPCPGNRPRGNGAREAPAEASPIPARPRARSPARTRPGPDPTAPRQGPAPIPQPPPGPGPAPSPGAEGRPDPVTAPRSRHLLGLLCRSSPGTQLWVTKSSSLLRSSIRNPSGRTTI